MEEIKKYICILNCLKKDLNNPVNKSDIHHAKYYFKNQKFREDINSIINKSNINLNDLNKYLLLKNLEKHIPEVLSHTQNNAPYYARKISIKNKEKEKIEFYLITKYYNDLFLYYDNFNCNRVNPDKLNTESDVEEWIKKLKNCNYSQKLELQEMNYPIKELLNCPNYVYKNQILIDNENYNKFIP